VLAFPRELGLTVLDDDELVREFALVRELLALADVDVVRGRPYAGPPPRLTRTV